MNCGTKVEAILRVPKNVIPFLSISVNKKSRDKPGFSGQMLYVQLFFGYGFCTGTYTFFRDRTFFGFLNNIPGNPENNR